VRKPERERDHLEDLSIDGRIISKRILMHKGLTFVDWIDLAQYRSLWQAFVKAVKNIRIL